MACKFTRPEGEKGETGSIEGAETAVGELPPDPATRGTVVGHNSRHTISVLRRKGPDGTTQWVPASPSIQGPKSEPSADALDLQGSN